MKVLSERGRYELLYQQFYETRTNKVLKPWLESFDRMFYFLYTQTDVIFLDFVTRDILYEYIRYHARRNFASPTFSEVIKDIKIFLLYLKKRGIRLDPEVDLSTLNYSLWLSIVSLK